MAESIIAYFGNPNMIHIFLNDAIDLYAASISFINPCEENPSNVNSDVNFSSDYWTRSFLVVDFVVLSSIVFLGKKINFYGFIWL